MSRRPACSGPVAITPLTALASKGRLRIIGWHGWGAIVARCIVGVVFSYDGWRQSQGMSDVARNVEL
jgi:hypothetical protein